jgi:hypothetical protein
MNKEIYNEIDLCVSELINKGVISENRENSELRTESIRFLKANNLIKPAKNRLQYNPASEIYDIKKVGIEKYLEDINKVKKLELENIIAENEKLKHEKDLRKLQINLADSNLESNRVSNKTSRVSMYVGVITLIALVTQIGISLYLDKQQTKAESLEEELKSKTKELTVFHRQIDSLKILLSNQNQTKKENEEKIKSSKKN